ncbi:unnamed protein product [Agarophyton chilense]|eukprot:gb/GEZJ01003569.1/.p2 GENE.gb/GEZJ01003569.1/~~gb/GEZJ01003569.1/.p2  ORF type:complete len:185 (-),score=11.24 gb/GEZJ01003569.1/:154-708(-)
MAYTETHEALLTATLLFAPLVLGVLQAALLEPRARAWHRTLRQWPCRPPPPVHALAWTWSYLSMGYASYAVRATANSSLLPIVATIYATHLACTHAWGVSFYVCRSIGGALFVMIVAVLTAVGAVASVIRVTPLIALLALPYVCWLLVLTYVNWYMWRHNARAPRRLASKKRLHAAHVAAKRAA